MKFILICWFAVIMPILHSLSNSLEENAPKNLPTNTLNHIAGETDHASFKENKLLIKEFADIINDYRNGSTNKVEPIERNELIQRIMVD
jgi:hypothetical protein